jgi:hypothetical protein
MINHQVTHKYKITSSDYADAAVIGGLETD